MALRHGLGAWMFLSLSLSSAVAHAKVWGGFDATRVNYAAGLLTGTAHNTLRATILANNDTVGALTGTLTTSYLNGIDVFYTSLLTNNGPALSAAEVSAVQAWVNGGGVLIVSGDIFNKPGYDSFVSWAGVSGFADAALSTATTQGSHPLVAGITTIGGTTHVTFNYNAANATLLANNANGPFSVVLDQSSGFSGSGCILVIGDHNAFTENYISNNDNLAFASNFVSWTATCGGPAPNGAPCSNPAACQSGFCVDGVCCDSACGGNVTSDCQACSVAAGASNDGTCAAASSTTVCRGAVDLCDVSETCDGTSLTCPADGLAATGTVCRAAVDLCDAAESCDGASSACPADGPEPAGTVCRAAADLCDAPESCDGSAISCPSDVLAAAGTECRAAIDVCDEAESCDGTTITCPTDQLVAAGTECRAQAGICDLADACDGNTPSCPADNFVQDGAACDDGDPNTTGDVCDAGLCVGEAAAGGAGGSGASSSSGGFTIDSDDDGVGVDSGCGCRTARGSDDGALWLLLTGLGVVAVRRTGRRRRRRLPRS